MSIENDFILQALQEKWHLYLEENTTFRVGTFISGPTFGCRREKSVDVKKDGIESYTDYLKKASLNRNSKI